MPESALVYRPGNNFFEEIIENSYRHKILEAKNIIIKAGSDVLVDKDGELDLEVMLHIAEDIAEKTREGYRIALISSGARVAGSSYVGKLSQGMTKRALCVGGQSQLMYAWNRVFEPFSDVKIGQILLQDYDFNEEKQAETREGFDEWYHSCNNMGIAIVNANDATWPGETEQDNDEMARKIYSLLNADFALFLSNIDGLLRDFESGDGNLVNWVHGIDENLYDLVSGGMKPKTRAIGEIVDLCGHAVIANGKKKHVIKYVLEGQNLGTYFSNQ